MKQKASLGFLILLTLQPLVPVTPTPTAIQWGLSTHMQIAEDAISFLDSDWEEFLTGVLSFVKGGAILPDSWHDLGDTPNHLYVPGNTSTSGHLAVERWYNYFVGNLSMGNYKEGITAGGVMAHYISDLNIPIHTGPWWTGHSAFEGDINYYYSQFTLGSVVLDEDIGDIQQYAIDAATHANQYYDIIFDAYPDETRNDEVINNATIKAIVEEQLTRAIKSVASLWKQGIGDFLAPKLVQESSKKALIDYGHSNEYVNDSFNEDKLANLISYLNSIGFEVIKDGNGLTSDDLNEIDFLIVTALKLNFSTSELTVVSDWLANNDQRSLFVTGKSDHYGDTQIGGINDLLTAIGTVIRVNDDNVYTDAFVGDPYYYQDHYIQTDNFYPPLGLSFPTLTDPIQLYRACSLYFESYSPNMQILANGSQYHYQIDETGPSINTIWDNTNDGTGGERIPLIAAETLSDDNDRIMVFAETAFSDFSFAPNAFQDNEHVIPVYLDWTLFGTAGVQTFFPEIAIQTTATEFSTDPFSIDYKISANVQNVELLLDGEVNETDGTTPFDSFTLTLDPGSYNVTLVVYNEGGNSTSDEILITVTVDETSETTTTTTTTEGSTPGFTLLALFVGIGLTGFYRKRKR
ncbi:MAG: hypothetical protein ACXAC6_00470 [Candidatus Hodarchaeales archaeon]|jgi:hypothetical protein